MQRLEHGAVGIQQGSQHMFTHSETGGPMWSGTGTREQRQAVVFSSKFKLKPMVTLNVSLWDCSAETNLRANLYAENITAAGFVIVFGTWGDTKIANLRVDWLAIGAALPADLWEL
jgi:hypothetical protein